MDDTQTPHDPIALIDMVINFGMLGYPLDKMLNIIPDDVDRYEFTYKINDPDDEIHKAYHKGIDRADYDIDTKLLSLFKAGDLKALDRLEERQYARKKKKK
jgi:hypothetical protein